MDEISSACTPAGDGCILAIGVTAGAQEDVFPAGFDPWRQAIRCRVTAPAVDGRANRAVLRLIADRLGVPSGDVTLVSGQTTSQKRVRVASRSCEVVVQALSAPGRT